MKHLLLASGILLSASYAGMASAASAAPRLLLQQVELVGYKGSQLVISVEIPCGGSLYGLVLAPGKRGVLQVAAAVNQQSFQCTSISAPVEFGVDFIDTKGFKAIAPMAVQEGRNRLNLARVTDLKLTNSSKDRVRRLRATYEPRCGETIGTLVRRTGTDRLEIGVAERPRLANFAEACNSAPRLRNIRGLNMRASYKIAAIKTRPASLNRLYHLRLAEVKPGSVQIRRGGGLAVSYRRICNEAPVGIVMHSSAAGGAGKVAGIGVLVAHYYNMKCSEPAGGSPWTLVFDKDLRIPGGHRISELPATAADGELVLKTPTMIRSGVSGGEQGLEYRHAGICRNPDAAVYARDQKGRLSIGLLIRDGSPVEGPACGESSVGVSLFQPFVSGSVAKGSVAPLRLRG